MDNEDIGVALKVLRKARDALAKGWTQGHWALNKNGDEVESISPEACFFCTIGAVDHALGNASEAIFCEVFEIQNFLVSSLPDSCKRREDSDDLIDYNDHPDTTHEDVLALFDRAIGLGRKKLLGNVVEDLAEMMGGEDNEQKRS